MSQWEIGERRGESYGGAGTFIQGDIKGCGKFFFNCHIYNAKFTTSPILFNVYFYYLPV